MDNLFFGVWYPDGVGHFHYLPGGQELPRRLVPVQLTEIDGVHCPPGPQEQSAARLVHRLGYTILACWDRTGDSRPGSNSAFCMRGDLTFEEALARAREVFPKQVSRIEGAAPIRPAKQDAPDNGLRPRPRRGQSIRSPTVPAVEVGRSRDDRHAPGAGRAFAHHLDGKRLHQARPGFSRP